MAKYLYINLPAEGHVNPTLAVVKELVERGNQVVYYATDDFSSKITNTGAEFRSLGSGININQMMEEKEPNVIMDHFVQMIEGTVDKVSEDIKNDSFDCVLYDANALPGKIIAKQHQLPSISTWSIFAIDDQGTMFEKLHEQSQSQTIIDPDRLNPWIHHWREKYDLDLPEFPQAMLCEGDLNIVFTSKYFQMDAEQFSDDTYTFVGPSLTEREDNESTFLPSTGHQPILFMSMGTVLNNQPDLYQKVIEAFADFTGTVIMSVGKQIDISSLGAVPDHFIVKDYVPQLEVLKHTDVFITHCGMNSTNEALYHQLPLVMLPAGNDQPIIAQRVEELGAGIRLNIDTVSPNDLRQAVNEVIENPTYQQQAAKISESFKNSGGYKRAVDTIQQFMEDYHFDHEDHSKKYSETT